MFIFCLLLLAGIIVMLRGCERGIGGGKSFESPNGEYVAVGYIGSHSSRSADDATLVLRLRITDRRTGTVVWQRDSEIRNQNNRPGYDQGNANEALVEWANDSTSVRFKDETRDWITVRLPDDLMD